MFHLLVIFVYITIVAHREKKIICINKKIKIIYLFVEFVFSYLLWKEGMKEMLYLMMQGRHFIYDL